MRKSFIILIVMLLLLMLSACSKSSGMGEMNVASYMDGAIVGATNSFGINKSPGSAQGGQVDYSRQESSKAVDMDNDAAPATAPMDSSLDSLDESGVTPDISITDPSRKLIRTANLSIETVSFDESLVELDQLCLGMQGFVAGSSVSGNSVTSRNTQLRRASFVYRIPSVNYNAFLNAVGNIGNTLNKTQNSQDVTYEYTDIESRVRMLRMRQERLEKLLERELDSIAVINYENSLTDTLYEIERLSGNLRKYDSLVEYSTIEVQLNEVRVYTEVDPYVPVPETAWERIQELFKDSAESLSIFFTDLIVLLAGNILYILIWVVGFGLVILIVRRTVRWLKKAVGRRPEKPRDPRRPVDSRYKEPVIDMRATVDDKESDE